ncbi:MAG: hypothetical protein QXL94_08240, partial [Candidatus Parvarchaeum sp.]
CSLQDLDQCKNLEDFFKNSIEKDFVSSECDYDDLSPILCPSCGANKGLKVEVGFEDETECNNCGYSLFHSGDIGLLSIYSHFWSFIENNKLEIEKVI